MSSSRRAAPPPPQIIYMPAPMPPAAPPPVAAAPNAPAMQPGVAPQNAGQGQPQGGRRQGSFGVGGGGDAGASSTMLAGSSGVDPRLLAIGKNTLLGA